MKQCPECGYVNGVHNKECVHFYTTTILDSGKITEFPTGAHRDCIDGKGRFDLIPWDILIRVARHYESGAVKYGENNWKKGMPREVLFNSAIRHLIKAFEKFDDEDHIAACIWNVINLGYFDNQDTLKR